MAYVTKTSTKRGARFVQSKKGTAIRTGKDGGTRVGIDHCTSKGKAFATGYGKSH